MCFIIVQLQALCTFASSLGLAKSNFKKQILRMIVGSIRRRVRNKLRTLPVVDEQGTELLPEIATQHEKAHNKFTSHWAEYVWLGKLLKRKIVIWNWKHRPYQKFIYAVTGH